MAKIVGQIKSNTIRQSIAYYTLYYAILMSDHSHDIRHRNIDAYLFFFDDELHLPQVEEARLSV